MRSVVNAFGLESDGYDKVVLLRHLEQHFLREVRVGQKNLLIIDQVEGLLMSSLQELRPQRLWNSGFPVCSRVSPWLAMAGVFIYSGRSLAA